MADEMENEYMKRGYLLPKDCKDLIDFGKSQATPKRVGWRISPLAPLPPITREMTVPNQMTVRELAAALAQKPFKIIADLMQFGVFANVSQPIDYDTLSKVLRKYGFAAKKAA